MYIDRIRGNAKRQDAAAKAKAMIRFLTEKRFCSPTR